MTRISDIISQIHAHVNATSLSKNALACKAGLAPNTLKKFWEDDWNPSLETLQKLEAALFSGRNDHSYPHGTPSSFTFPSLTGKRILLIITGGIAAYKSLDLIRRLQDCGADVTGVMTAGASEFITPLSVASLTGNQCYIDLFDLKEESEMGHIKLSRDNDLILIAPATADMMAKMVAGLANDLASTLLLATDKPVMLAPAMNSQMWAHPATQRNLRRLKEDGLHIIDPANGLLACGETGPGKLADVMDIVRAVGAFFHPKAQPLTGKTIILTAGPTHEIIDPVRYIANRSSGKQGFALASALTEAGAAVTLITGPVSLETPMGVHRINVESARDMHEAVHAQLPADFAIFVAAVADWRTEESSTQKMKKEKGGIPTLKMAENPDILASVAHLKENRPEVVIGFAAETENVIEHGKKKRLRKGCEWIIANNVSHTDQIQKGVVDKDVMDKGVMGGNQNQVHIISDKDVISLPEATKKETAQMIVHEIIRHYA
ncbi:bifunctional phosphopantothenoylcysteine decarboxylase/phosphopantothenate--cysteine ligase CoaBC [Temperatibacter marinus]|uniref:Coenzyme A biosynthesis bifunctional protein CoaBC n=1 Tax=Temperatibacter marinus TaxID=1456591 RepID=A0AA52EFF1_9PROT|nr:bifunctional phosphopantothenoylcysteine decarboxylase/phosphopantothenate--cysteine ligase CoaBC [Temperatibacter marinus]WND03796.1 bifunctional phosphopantothenoylcysteine decarboxylase/phosphopantothenate--cysteine ligase CoaBC [Temperatibacter marinus]